MLVVYLGNNGESIEWGTPPLVGDVSQVGTVASLEFYKGELETVCLAVCGKITRADDETFDIQLAPDNSIINYGWSLIGRPPTGRLNDYEPTGDGDGMKAVPSNWCVDVVDTCKPMIEGTYKAIHLCHCVKVGLPVAA